MSYTLYRATLVLKSPFGSTLTGDTLFGQLCWAMREVHGEAKLRNCLQGYTEHCPWLVVSDAFPSGYLPKPILPTSHLQISAADRKKQKKARWISLNQIVGLCKAKGSTDNEAFAAGTGAEVSPQAHIQTHNTINRLTNTTGTDEFAPFSSIVQHYAINQHLDIWLIINTEKTDASTIKNLLEYIGAIGFGRDASSGLGKFDITQFAPHHFTVSQQANAWMTLAPCAPQGLNFDSQNSYWRTHTHFGRHGNVYALTGKPFKSPLLLAATAAVFSPTSGKTDDRLWIGQGLGGNGSLSKTEANTVHQGYAPVVPFRLEIK